MPNAPAHIAPPRLVFLGLVALTLAAVVMVASLGHSSMATRATTYALLAQSSLAMLLAITHRDEIGSLRRAMQIFTMVVICLLTGALGWFFGPNSGFAAFIALAMIMIGLLSRGPAVKRPQLVGWSLFASLAVGQAAVVIAVLSGLVLDASLTPVHRLGQSVGKLIIAHVAIQGLYIAAFVVGRLFQRRYNELVQRIDETIRVTAQRDALLDEARAEYRRALATGRRGVFSGNQVGQYRLGGVIGRGSTGEVYEAVHVETNERAAVKLLRGDRLDDGSVVQRFLREGEIARRVESPHVARVLEVSSEGIPFIAMEATSGDELSVILRERRMTDAELRALVEAVSRALESVHAAGALHLDVSPGNVMCASDGRFLLVDFGVAQLRTALEELPQGTPRYVAPERLEGKRADERADLYGLAAILYYAATGNEPLAGMPPIDPRKLAPISESLANALATGLAVDPRNRFSSAAALRTAFLDALDGKSVPAKETSWTKRAPETGRRAIVPPSRASVPPPPRASVPPPSTRSGETAGPYTAAGSTATDTFQYKTRVFQTSVFTLCGGGALLLGVIVHDRTALGIAWAAILGIVITALIQMRIAKRLPVDRPLTALWAVITALSAGPAYALGINSGFAAVVATMLFMGGLFASMEHVADRKWRGILLSIILGSHTLILILVIARVVPDLGNQRILLPGKSVADIVAGHSLLVLVYVTSYALGRGVDRRYELLVARAEALVREAARKEALLATAREELDRALSGERRGIFSGLRVGTYDVTVLLGRGSMGEVYEATRDDGTRVALKLVRADCVADPIALRMFLKEADALRRVQSENVARVFEIVGIEGEVPYIAMEYIDGPSLQELLRTKRRLSLDELRVLVREISRGLADVHRAGVLHRDVKPDNVIHMAGGAWKLVDFGVATLIETGTRSLVGTPNYMAPEQAFGEPVDRRADLYSLCLVVYRALTGRPAFIGRNHIDIARNARDGGPPDPRAFVPDLPESLVFTLRVGLAAELDQRFVDADELGRAFEDAFAGRIRDDVMRCANEVNRKSPWTS